MKKIQLTFWIFLIFFAFASPSYGQLRVGTGPSLAIPLGDFGTISKNGYGASVGGKFWLSERFALTANVSYFAFGRAGDDINELGEAFGISQSSLNLLNAINADTLLEIPNVDFFPINVGFEYYILTGKAKPYVGMDLSLYATHTENITIDLDDLVDAIFEQTGTPSLPANFGTIDLAASDVNGGISAVAGFAYHFDERWSLDLNMKANSIFVPDRRAAPVVLSFHLGVFVQIFSEKEKQNYPANQ